MYVDAILNGAIFKNNFDFEATALDVFRFQYNNNLF